MWGMARRYHWARLSSGRHGDQPLKLGVLVFASSRIRRFIAAAVGRPSQGPSLLALLSTRHGSLAKLDAAKHPRANDPRTVAKHVERCVVCEQGMEQVSLDYEQTVGRASCVRLRRAPWAAPLQLGSCCAAAAERLTRGLDGSVYEGALLGRMQYRRYCPRRTRHAEWPAPCPNKCRAHHGTSLSAAVRRWRQR